jgi:hypothetical protein
METQMLGLASKNRTVNGVPTSLAELVRVRGVTIFFVNLQQLNYDVLAVR